MGCAWTAQRRADFNGAARLSSSRVSHPAVERQRKMRMD